MASTLNWKGDEVGRNVREGLKAGLTEFGLRCETAAKRRLQPGHGVRTGTLRRSLHIAEPGYSWQGDNVPPSSGSPERGGKVAAAGEKGSKLSMELGSGLEYAMAVHQGHGSFEGYHFLTEAVAEQSPKLLGILKRHVGGKL